MRLATVGCRLRSPRLMRGRGSVRLQVSYENPERRLPVLEAGPCSGVTHEVFSAEQDWHLYICRKA
jgi:hypothetical protein